MDLKELVNRKNELVAMISNLEGQVKELDSEIIHKMVEGGQETVFGSSGIGYALVTGAKAYEYKPGAYTYLEKKGLLHHFCPPPKITRKKLEELLKAEELTFQDLANLDEHHTVTDHKPYSLRRVVSKEAKVIA